VNLRVAATITSVVALLASCAQPAPAPASEAQTGATTRAQALADVQAQLIAQADAWDKAIVRQDRAAIEANMHAGFFQIGGRGERTERAEFIDGLMDPKLKIAPYAVENLEVHLHGNTALLTATTRMSGQYDGKPFSSHYRYIDVYLRENGAWKIVSVQITRIADP
jgi:ketosteroid isomerase-like protein